MATQLCSGPRTWSGSRDSEGHREYKVKYLVRCDKTDGPANILQTPGLPLPGAMWAIDADLDIWAWCRQDATVTPLRTNEPNTLFEVEFTFSTKPGKRCQDAKIEDPILEPPSIKINSVRYQFEATNDRFFNPVVNSAHEQIRGKEIEVDASRIEVTIGFNVPILNLPLVISMLDTVNDAPLWGMARRSIKFSAMTCEPKYYGLCYKYYALSYTFEARRETFDKFLLDQGTRALSGHWSNGEWVLEDIDGNAPDPNNPNHFVKYRNRHGDPDTVILNGRGLPANVTIRSARLSVSIVDNNLGNRVSDSNFWCPILLEFGIDDFDPDFLEIYSRGQLTKVEDSIYICIVNGPQDTPDELGTLEWIVLATDPPGLDAPTTYNAGINYNTGDIVEDVEGGTAPGSIPFAPYTESNFLLLGIPVIL